MLVLFAANAFAVNQYYVNFIFYRKFKCLIVASSSYITPGPSRNQVSKYKSINSLDSLKK